MGRGEEEEWNRERRRGESCGVWYVLVHAMVVVVWHASWCVYTYFSVVLA